MPAAAMVAGMGPRTLSLLVDTEMRMKEQGTVTLVKQSTGGVAIRVSDGSYILADQLDSNSLEPGRRLSGHMSTIGVENLVDAQSGETFSIFIQAYGLSYEAVREELA
jgi:hypothetical protein